MFGELTENLTRHRNELLKKRDHLTRSAVPVPGQQTVGSCACSKTVAMSQFCTSDNVATLSTGRYLAGSNVAITTTQPDKNYVV